MRLKKSQSKGLGSMAEKGQFVGRECRKHIFIIKMIRLCMSSLEKRNLQKKLNELSQKF